jgi:hypothetical protein
MKNIILLIIIAPILSYSQVSNPQIFILPVKNSIKMGMMTGNVNLTLGVKNILSEAIQEKNYDEVMNPDSVEYTLQADLVYFDILKTNSNISVFHKDETETIIRIKGTLFKKGKKVKEIVVEESSNEISTSTLAVNYDGSFNQQSARQAIKKACIKLTKSIL